MAEAGFDFQVDKQNLRETRLTDLVVPDEAGLSDGEVLLAIDRFAFTANNITYAAFGEAMGYWNFFPAPQGWGRVPVWGFADVVASRCAKVAIGERVYGYLPMSSHLVIRPGKIRPGSLIDTADHRQPMAPVYNQYVRVLADPAYDRASEAHQALLRPLFLTSFVIDDMLMDNEFFGATQVVLSSASSKTSLGTAFCLSQRKDLNLKVIGLTSARNKTFVEATGYYDQIVTYDEIGGLDPTIPTVFVDMAGDAVVRSTVHHHFGESLKYSCSVGGTHWEGVGGGAVRLPGPKPTLFFAPTQIQKRTADWGPGGFDQRVAHAWASFKTSVDGWMNVVETHGASAFKEAYEAVLEGRVLPSEGHIFRV
jgi:hypothetical protein